VGFGIANGEIVDADETDASLDEKPRAASREAHEVARESVAIPELGIGRLEEDPREVIRERKLTERFRVQVPLTAVASTTDAGPMSVSRSSDSVPAPPSMK
jgi:hypothetical protein